ncbi:sigma-70 family RNA polymerase sigma factor [Isoptericola sp. BMS4]|uniref:sigma-70 family RNA polymerase sigma factor n=1 Tax=Isoptericola sp. BMS4 TaxID=2527875 RepID=UPI00141E58FA|nr:sigma-70 family RNA polymerase sigma factor [Isoptericola sp. BMS4]
MTEIFARPEDSARSDAELILDVRDGDSDAYGALYARHAAAARSVARSYVRSSADVDDVVAEAFQRVLQVLQHGGGPDTTFRAYLFTVVRRLAVDVVQGRRRTRPTDDESTLDAGLGAALASERAAMAGFERSVVRQAYEALPERWQAVLWYTEVEGCTPAQIAPVLGLTPNGVAALAYRAREGLRVGYLQEHLQAEPSQGCRAVNPLLGSYVRGGLSRRETAKVDAHLETCGGCREIVLELGDVARGMRAVIAPLVLGTVGMTALGALPLGGVLAGGLVGAGGAAAGGAGVTAGVGSAAGAVSAGAGATGAGAAGSAAAVGTSAGASAGAGAATVAAGSAAGSAAGTTAGTAVAVATGTAAVTGTSVAATAGAVMVATAGVMTALTALDDPPPEPPVQPAAVSVPGAPWEEPLTGTGISAAPEDEPPPADGPADKPDGAEPDGVEADPFAPTNLLGGVPPVDLVPSATLEAAVAPAPLEPRVTQDVAVTVTNTGEARAEDAMLEVALPEGMELVPAPPSGGDGGTLALAPADAGAATCVPATEEERRVRCRVGDLEPGETRTRYVAVTARDGGSYALGAELWASGVARRAVDLAPTTVRHYGAELTVGGAGTSGAPVALTNPGDAWVPVAVRNTGDLTASAPWSVRVEVPAGLRAVDAQGDLTCTGVEGGTAGGGPGSVWRCAPVEGAPALAPGETRTAQVRVVADGTSESGVYPLAVSPESSATSHTVGGAVPVDVAEAWAVAAAGAGSLSAVCTERGGVGVARAAVVGSYLNTSTRPVTVRLDAAGASGTAERTVSPGGSVVVEVPDGLRVPAGSATWTVSTTVAGATYRTTVPAGSHGSADCYAPAWDVSASADVVNVDGRLQVRATVTNDTGEAMQVGLSAAGADVAPVRVGAGQTVTLTAATGERSLPAGDAVLALSRWVVDADGDAPASASTPAVAPRVGYAATTLAPALAGDARPAGECRFDDAAEVSSRAMSIPVDNTASDLPVRFAVDDEGVRGDVLVPAGETGALEVRVPWGTTGVDVTADGRPLGTVTVPSFDSCATVSWPEGSVHVQAAAVCSGTDALTSVTVRNDGDVRWTAAIRRGAEEVPSARTRARVAPGESAELRRAKNGAPTDGGAVLLWLGRTLEGERFVVVRAFTYDGVSCVEEQQDAVDEQQDAGGEAAGGAGDDGPSRQKPDDDVSQGGEGQKDQKEPPTPGRGEPSAPAGDGAAGERDAHEQGEAASRSTGRQDADAKHAERGVGGLVRTVWEAIGGRR